MRHDSNPLNCALVCILGDSTISVLITKARLINSSAILSDNSNYILVCYDNLFVLSVNF
nr:MAG TPA: hypothetical protein [Caudoviricetes sp.]